MTLFTGKIEEIGISMLEFLMKERRDVFALLYEEGDGRAKKIIQRLESIDNELALNTSEQSVIKRALVTPTVRKALLLGKYMLTTYSKVSNKI